MYISILNRLIPEFVQHVRKTNRRGFLAFMIIVVTSCDDLIEYSPYDVPVKTQNINIHESEIISLAGGSSADTLKIALFSDVHENYDDMSDAIISINKQPDLQFVVSCGDITCSGLEQEYSWYLEIAGGLKYPLITAIGNHDFLANGLDVYKKLFGNPNLSFVCRSYKFIVFNCAILENYNKSPEYEWLSRELSDTTHNKIFISHIAPVAGDFDDLNRMVFNNIVKAGGVKLCMHGHFHYFKDFYYNDIHSIIADEIKSREYYIIKLIGDQSFVETIKF